MAGKKRKRYVQVGLGGRAQVFTESMAKTFRKTCDLMAICDNNSGRLALAQKHLVEKYDCPGVLSYSDRQFDKMIAETKPDVLVVTCKDSLHDKYIIRGMELGCDIITEKPLTIDEKKCQKIIDTASKTGRQVRVTFNYRYSPPRVQVKELIQSGLIGEVLSVGFEWALNTSHGADYFRRWHREKKNSGGLMVHKATHHFDLINWWLGASPVEVYAKGKRGFYGSKSGMAKELGLAGHAERCRQCKYLKGKCNFALDMQKNKNMRELYLQNEKYDKYYRDRCVFGKTMDIEDNMNLVVSYDSGTIMTYSLNAFLPWEGYRVSFNGTKGRLEHVAVESVYVSGDGKVQGETVESGTTITHYPNFKKPREIKVRTAKGGHGGGDDPLQTSLFSGKKIKDPLKKNAGIADGACSILTGIAANKSMKSNKPVKVSTLVKRIPAPSWKA